MQGHTLVAEDLRIMYSFSGEKSKELSEKYEADSSGDILVMLDTSPDQGMLDEGVAREVVNRVQKLRKTTGLKVADKVTMFYTIKPAEHSLNRILTEFGDYIETASKTPLRPLPSPAPSNPMGAEQYELKGAALTLTVSRGFPAGFTGGSPSSSGGPVPAAPWCNVSLLNCAPAPHAGSSEGALLLPASLSLAALTVAVQQVFGLYGVRLELCRDTAGKVPIDTTSDLDGQTVYAFKTGAEKTGGVGEVEGFNCKFVNVMAGGEVTSLLLVEVREGLVSLGG